MPESFEEWKARGIQLGGWQATMVKIAQELWPSSGLEWHAGSEFAIFACEDVLYAIDLSRSPQDRNGLCNMLAAYNRFYKNHKFPVMNLGFLDSLGEIVGPGDEDEVDLAAQFSDCYAWIVGKLGLDQRVDWPQLDEDIRFLSDWHEQFGYSLTRRPDDHRANIFLARLTHSLIYAAIGRNTTHAEQAKKP